MPHAQAPSKETANEIGPTTGASPTICCTPCLFPKRSGIEELGGAAVFFLSALALKSLGAQPSRKNEGRKHFRRHLAGWKKQL